MSMRTGIWLIGARGSVAGSATVSASALRARLVEPTGYVTELPALRGTGLPRWSNLREPAWSGIKLYGGGDGAILSNPGPNAAEVASKQRILRDVLGHQGTSRVDHAEGIGDFELSMVER
ncbi:hypothetical protein [Micromonospora sp. KC723]|uniref:hypothetical protein n=1 Tax=Micromonospora sp. KC723 TaxID=2530381 RepID=UPI00105108C4|nr:hypothetical protein [Micromonospora sp. KC723]TDB72248.1 hypothetical protein E1165_20780 [Micromonospora sp. KC723]